MFTLGLFLTLVVLASWVGWEIHNAPEGEDY